MVLVYKVSSRKWATLGKLSHLVATPFGRGPFQSQTHPSALETFIGENPPFQGGNCFINHEVG